MVFFDRVNTFGFLIEYLMHLHAQIVQAGFRSLKGFDILRGF